MFEFGVYVMYEFYVWVFVDGGWGLVVGYVLV